MRGEMLGEGEEDAESNAFSGLSDLGEIRESGSDADNAVGGIFVVRMGASSGGERDAGLSCEIDDAVGAAVGNEERDEVAAARIGPGDAGEAGEF